MRRLRTYIMLAVAAVSASLEAPRIAHEPLKLASAEMTAAPAVIGRAVTTAAEAITKSHVGFDTNIYPGDNAMDAWKSSGDYEWVGYYLKARCHSDTSWSGKRERLVNNGWGLAVIYVGQQTWGKTYEPVAMKRVVAVKVKPKKGRKHFATRMMTRKSTAPVATTAAGCSASFVNAAQGTIDARDAIANADREGFPKGSVVFLDVEYMPSVPQRMRDYYRAWTQALLADGRYRPGVYAHTHNAETVFSDVSDVYGAAGVKDEPPFWIAGSRGFSTESMPTDVGHKFASMWQGLLDVVREHNGVRLPIDISVSRVPSPSLTQ